MGRGGVGRSGEYNCIRDPEQLLENANALIIYYCAFSIIVESYSLNQEGYGSILHFLYWYPILLKYTLFS